MRQVFFGDPAAAVRDSDDGPVAFPADLHGDAGAGGAVDNGVEHDVPDGASHRGAVGEGQTFPPAAAVERYAMLFRQRGEVGDGVAGEVVQIQRLGLQPHGSGMDPGQLQEVVDHARHEVGLRDDLPVVARDVRRHAVFECLGHGPHARQRSPQIMRDPADEFAAGVLDGRLALP